MKQLIIFFILVDVVACFPEWFEEYKREYNKTYTDEEAVNAYQIMLPKYNHIKNNTNLQLKLHEFSDKHRQKRRLDYTRGIPKLNERLYLGLPLTFDWRTKGTVTPPIAQGECGGCFAFAAISSLEHWYKKKTGNLVNLSVQEALDCSTRSNGCDGGLMEDVFISAMQHPISLRSYDTFKMTDMKCPHIRTPHIRVKSFSSMSKDWNPRIESSLARNIVRYGPVTVGIDTQNLNFELYKGGIIDGSHCGKDIDHAVAVVGFTREYWIIKNSWGTAWGEDGYFRLKKGRNACGISTYASFVTDATTI